jgi:unsaturated chondroitin disaccharide hydrolase
MMKIDYQISPESLTRPLEKFWQLSGEKIKNIEQHYDISKGSPVFTVKGKYATRGWTEWTQGFQFGSSILQFDATGEMYFLESGRKKTVKVMAPHISHVGVHDHGFNNVSTYGNLLRLMQEGKIPYNEWEKNFYELALKISGAVQANRWTRTKNGGFIYSFNGPHSLFVDTIRSCRALMVSHKLGHLLQAENDIKISLLERALLHCRETAAYSVYYGEGRDAYDLPGRTAHESLFNVVDGNFRAPNAQQGFSGFSTWTRGLAWAMCGFAEELECMQTFSSEALDSLGGKAVIESFMLKAAKATCEFYITNTAQDGIPYWDTGAPQLHKLGDYLSRASDPYNNYEPVDSSAAAIGAQGLLRLGKFLRGRGDEEAGKKYVQAGLTVLNTLLGPPYLSMDANHQGLLLHSVYHWPNRWDYVPEGSNIPYGESSMWGDYHIRELALYVQKLSNGDPYYTFFNCIKNG